MEHQIYNIMGEGKYLNIWKQKLPIILSTIENKGNEEGIQLSAEEFKKNGNKPNSGYDFRLNIVNGIVTTKSNSAVTRDLKEVPDNSTLFKRIAQNKKLRFDLEKLLA